ncbi:hypothetical protein [Pengzhenrongella sp.]|jgi:hypothetical protein|uniref:hypothetical protein n=1 Tax=Pengzhenrongella sp. TaxID=2888820 RepID=UPI002F93912B
MARAGAAALAVAALIGSAALSGPAPAQAAEQVAACESRRRKRGSRRGGPG